MSLTPTIRAFLVQLDDLLDRKAAAGLRRDATHVTTGDAAALVRLPHVTDRTRDVEIAVEDHRIVVGYPPERVIFVNDPDDALRFVEMLCDGRVELEITHGLLWTTMRSYRDGQSIPFRRTRMPWPSLRPHTERHAVGFGT